jgi:hypothetical protein
MENHSIKYFYVTDCANLGTPTPQKNEYVELERMDQMEINEMINNLQTGHWKNKDDSDTPKINEFLHFLQNLPFDKLSSSNWKLNMDCCDLCFFKTQKPGPYLMDQEAIKQIFPND